MSYNFRMICALALALTSLSLKAQVNITMNWTTGAFAAEPGWEVIRVATNTTVFCEATAGAAPFAGATILNLAPGVYEVRGFDSFGDGWNGGLLTFSQGALTLFSSAGPPNAGFFPGANACPGPSPVNGVSSSVLGTFTVVLPTCMITCPANITVNTSPGICAANVTVPEPTTSGCAQAPANNQTFASAATPLSFVNNGLVQTSANISAAFPSAVANGTLRVNFTGDFDAVGLENTPILDENGVQIGIIGAGTAQCAASVANFAVTAAQINSWAANGSMTFSVAANINVNAICTPNQIQFSVIYPTALASATNSFNGTSNASGQYPLGTTTVVWTAQDITGVPVTCSMTVTVQDRQAPNLVCPANSTVNLAPGACSEIVSYTVAVSDNCPTGGFASSTVDTLQSGNSGISCAFGGNPFAALQNFYYKVLPASNFPANSTLKFARVRIATDFFNTPANVTVRIYRLVNPAQPFNVSAANRVQIAASNPVPVPLNSNGQRLTVPLSGVIPAGSAVLMEFECDFPFVIAQFQSAGGGDNTWIGSTPCGIPPANPGTFTSVGFPLQNIPALLYFDTPINLVQTSGLPSGASFPIGVTTNCFSATDAAGNVSTCCFTVNVKEFPNPIKSLVCNDLVNISLDANCTAVVGADQILEGGPYGCYDDYIVELDKTPPFNNGPWVPAVLGPGDVGKTYQVRVTDPENFNNRCWGNIKVEDKLAPTLVCPPVEVPCNSAALPGDIAAFSNLAFESNRIPVPDGQTVTATANVALPAGAPIVSVKVRVVSNHTWIGDLSGRLTSPSGQTINLFSQPGVPASAFGCASPGMNVTFDDAAAQTYAQFETTCNAAAPAIAGLFQPEQPISLVTSANMNGAWTFTFSDPGFGDASTETYGIMEFTVLTAVPFPNALTSPPVTNLGNRCYSVPAGAGTPVMEACSATNLCYTDVEVQRDCPTGLTKIVNRKWTATDASGNSKTCVQEIRFRRPTLNDVAFPPDYDDVNSPAFACAGAYPTPQWIAGQGLQGSPLVFGAPDGCSIQWTYTDTRVNVCDGTYKIRRVWAIIDWCSGTSTEYVQLIKVLDKAGPVIACPANVTASTDAFTCCGSVNLPDVIVEDACSDVVSISAMVIGIDPQTLDTIGMFTVGGFLSGFPGNNLWDRDTLANFGTTPCLPIGRHTVIYTATDDCGNSTTCSFRLEVRDYTEPVAACDKTTTVAIGIDDPYDCYLPDAGGCGFAGVTWIKATTFDDGSYDNCGPVRFTIQRMQPYSADCIQSLNGQDGTQGICDDTDGIISGVVSEFERAISEYDSIKFYCCEVGTTQTVILRVYQLDAQGNLVVGPDGTPVHNSCMIDVEVQDKIRPVCSSPAPVTVSCENFDPSLWAYGIPKVEDNCCLDTSRVYQGQCGLTHSVSYTQFDTLCNRGTITRTFRAYDCHGQSQQCTQRIIVNYEQDYFLRFPDDRIVSVCDGTGNFGEPTFLNKDCELLGVSFTDEVFTVVPDACYKIERTWHVINWCRYNNNLPLTVVPNPNPNATVNSPANNPGPVISSSSNANVIAAPWTATRVSLTPGAAQTDFSVFYLGGSYTLSGQTFTVPTIENSNGFSYKQIIKVLDTQDPVIANCPASPVTVCDLTPNDPQLWNQSYWWDNRTMSHDLCEAPTDLSITATDACSGSNITIKYLLFLDTDQNGSMETVVSSTNLPGFNNVQYNNGQNPNFTGGTSQAFDGRPVPSNQKYGFALQTTVSGNNKTGAVRWNTFQSQSTYVVPELPYGTHKIKWTVEDGCGNESTCEYQFVVRDCKAPTVVCRNGLSVNIMPTGMIALWASDFLQYTEDNCTPVSKLVIGIRRVGVADGQGNTTGFPRNADGTPQTNVNFTCADVGTKEVELWSIDLANNADFCQTYVIIQDNGGFCSTAATVAGVLATEGQAGLEDATVTVEGSSNGIPMTSKVVATNDNGFYQFSKSVPFGSNFTVTPTNDNNPLNGVSTYDLVLISKHILGLEPLNSPYKMISADANKSGSITTFDIVEIRKLILGIYTELPNNTSWRFVDKAHTFSDPANPFKAAFPENKTIANLTLNLLDENFVAMKVGDVNGSATANSLMAGEDRTAGTLMFDVEDRAVKAGEEFEVTFKAAAASQGYQMTLNLNGLSVSELVESGKVGAQNFGVHADALTVSVDGSEEFSVKFRASKSGQLSEMLGVSSRITRAEAYTLGSERQEVALRFNSGVISGLGFELYQNQPNPFVSKTFIGFHLPEAATATLTVFDESGRALFVQKGDFAKGYNNISLDRAAVGAAGVLYYKLETSTDSATKKMIQTK